MHTGILKHSLHFIVLISFFLCLLLIFACDDSQGDIRTTSDDQIDLIGNNISDRFLRLSQNESVSAQESYTLLMAYCNRYLSIGGESKPEIETFLIKHIGERAAGYGFANLVRNKIDISFTENLKSRMKAGNDTEEVLFRHSEILFDVMRIYQKPEKSQNDWKRIVVFMESARDILPSYIYNDVLILAYKALDMDRKLFELSAYKSFDLGRDGQNGHMELQRLWRSIEGEKQSFREEIDSVNAIVMDDIVNRSEPGIDFQLDDEIFLLGDSNDRFIVDYQSEESPVYRKHLAVAVFSTDCLYCEKELKILSNLESQYEDSLAIVALRECEGGEIEPYGRKNRITIPLLINDESRILEELDVSSVPVLFLFNDEGKLIKKVRFRNQAHLEDKIRWILDDAIH